ncbi:MAG: bifunctional transaldolase/phosoglucose isomerase [Thermaerobacter sp.]|nr:bifunctional transaldolase/phosoglucose isomerase [Thermaerobacter sp.]
MADLMQLRELGQSVWIDYILRSYLTSGGFTKDVARGVRGVTSNPAIFEHAIGKSDDYDPQLGSLYAFGSSPEAAFEELALRDIRLAAEILRALYDGSEGLDGYVSLEVSPELAHDAEGTIREALHLRERLQVPNVMIKVPGTPEGAKAIEELIYRGVNINVTLLFSLTQHRGVAEAYLRGLERRAKEGLPLSGIHSVASFFVSRVDTLVDERLQGLGGDALQLRGKAAVANAKRAYRLFQEIFGDARFLALKTKGANVQRPLWASTSTKNPDYRDVLYVEDLIGPDTVNTLPPKTIEAFLDHGVARETLTHDLGDADAVEAKLRGIGIDLEAVGDELQRQGVQLFSEAFQNLRAEIARKAAALVPDPPVQAVLKDLAGPAAEALQQLRDFDAPKRLRRKDATLYPDAQRKIAETRLGWIDLPQAMAGRLPELEAFQKDLTDRGVQRLVLVGMGGSSLFPDVLQRMAKSPGIAVDVLDTTHPDYVHQVVTSIDWRTTAVLLSSKSGGTREVDALYRILRAKADTALGHAAGKAFYAITDPGTSLERRAQEEQFSGCFLNPPDIGGRYSALSLFGLVPAAVLGGDIAALLKGGAAALEELNGPVERSAAAALAAVLQAAHAAGRGKIVLPSPQGLPFSDWLEQLLAESTGKQGKGILPAPGAMPGEDRIAAGFGTAPAAPGVQLPRIDGMEALGRAVVTWEAATALFGFLAGMSPFDQPNVQEGKDNTEAVLREGDRPSQRLQQLGDPESPLSARPPAYLAVQAFVPPTQEVQDALRELQSTLSQSGVAVTVGVGPRFLHSTGQYHKGGPSEGCFLQIVAPPQTDIDLPGLQFSLADLFAAQAEGDAKALVRRERPLARILLDGDPADALRRVGKTLVKNLKGR